MTKNSTDQQAQAFTHYLLKRPATTQALGLYEQAINNKVSIDKADHKLLAYIEKHPWSLGVIDAGLPYLKPYSEVRRRLYIMLAILEASPDYFDAFLPQKRSPLYLIYIAYSGLRAIAKAVLGLVLIKVVTR